jgi:large subunit ribosomal protein L32
MRSANKGLKDKQSGSTAFGAMFIYAHNERADVVHCPGCGAAKLAHHLCPHCYSSINRAWKSKSRNDGTASVIDTPS